LDVYAYKYFTCMQMIFRDIIDTHRTTTLITHMKSTILCMSVNACERDNFLTSRIFSYVPCGKIQWGTILNLCNTNHKRANTIFPHSAHLYYTRTGFLSILTGRRRRRRRSRRQTKSFSIHRLQPRPKHTQSFHFLPLKRWKKKTKTKNDY